MSYKFVCRVCFKHYELAENQPECPFCHSTPEESYWINSDVVTAFLRIMQRNDSVEERFRAVDEVLKVDWDFAVQLGKMRSGASMSGWISPRDRHVIEQVLINYPRKNPVVLEVGVAGGGGSNTILVARRDCVFVGIDNWSADPSYESDFHVNTSQFKDRVTVITGDSEVVGKTWSTVLDVLLVDGGHEYEVVAADVANFVPWVRNGGMLMFDDYYTPTVMRAVDAGVTVNPDFELVRKPNPQFSIAEKLIVFRRKSGFEHG